jgi:hypothetical protein
MMGPMLPKAVVSFAVILSVLAGSVGVLAEISHQTQSSGLLWVMIARLAEVLFLALFGVYAAQGGGLRGSVVLTAEDGREVFLRVFNYGVLPGIVLGLVNHLFFFYGRYSPFVQERVRSIDTIWDVLVVSADTSILEEVTYRLFLLSCLLFLLQHLYRSLRVGPVLEAQLPRALAIFLSSLLFAFAHTVSGFTAALVGGILLGIIYLMSGVESAVAAHFSANLFFFSASYLS